MTTPSTAALDVEIAKREREIFQLDTAIAERTRALTAHDQQLAQLREKNEAALDVWRKQTAEAETHFRETYARVEREYQEKVADFNGSIEALRQRRAAEVEAIAGAKALTKAAVDELGPLSDEVALLRNERAALENALRAFRVELATAAAEKQASGGA